jgi:hypothetical protein
MFANSLKEKLLFKYGDELFTHPSSLVTEQFEVYIRVRAEIDPRALSGVSPNKQSLRQKGMAPVRNAMLQRGATNSLRWVLTQIPTGDIREA